MDSDDDGETNIFLNRADRIMKTRMKAYEKLAKDLEEEKVLKKEEEEYNDLLIKIKEKLKRKPGGKKGKATKKAKVNSDSDISMEEDTPGALLGGPSRAGPSGPPRVTIRNARRTKQPLVENVIEEAAKPRAASPINLPVLAKRRLNELRLRTDREAAQVEEEVRISLSSCDKSFSEAADVTVKLEMPQTITLKIRFLSEISKIIVQENENFATIFPKVADLYKLKASEILLCLEDRNIKLEDTPLSLNLKFYDVIDCIPYKASQKVVKDNDPNRLLVKFQSRDGRKIEMHIHKLEKFQDFLEKYSNLRHIPLKDLTFEFDGETIKGSETPEELDMESGSCIDVKVPEEPKDPEVDIIVDYIAPIPQSQMLDICELD